MSSTARLAIATPIAVLLAAGCTNSKAGTPAGATGAAGGGISSMERIFIENAIAAGQLEVEHAKLAATNASNSAVKEYASQLLTAHTAVNNELASIIQQRQIDVREWSDRAGRPGSVGAPGDATTATKLGNPPNGAPSPTGTTGASGTIATTGEAIDRAREGMTYPWMQASGAEFDQGFVAAQIKAHQNAIALFDQQANTGSDAELKAFAAKHLPEMRDHLRRAEELQRTISGNP